VIDDTTFEDDVKMRGTQPFGARTPTPTLIEALSLKPLLVFAFDEPDPGALERGLIEVADLLGQSHCGDDKLIELFWPNGNVPSAAKIVAMGQGYPVYDAVITHYRTQSTNLLLAMATEFGMAKLLGLGCENALPSGVDPYQYRITGHWVMDVSVYSRVFVPAGIWPIAPILRGNTGIATAGYPSFACFYKKASPWRPILPTGVLPCERMYEAARRGPRLYPTPTAKLKWSMPMHEQPRRDDTPPLLTYEPCYWQVQRYHFANANSGAGNQPQLPADAVFSNCHDGERVARQKVNEFEDDLDLPWGEQPLEGWYAYRVSGIDLFGVTGSISNIKFIYLCDEIAPPPPRPSIVEQRVVLKNDAASILPVLLDWDATQELVAPDMVKFHIRQLWTKVEYCPVKVLAVDPIVDPNDPSVAALNYVQADVRIGDADGLPWNAGKVPPLTDGTLLTPDGEFAILAIRGTSVIRVRRSAGRAPPLGGAAARYATPATDGAPQVVSREPSRTGAIVLVNNSPMTVKLTPINGLEIPADKGRLYSHLLGASFAVRPDDSGNGFFIDRPAGGAADVQAYDVLSELSLADAQAFINGSPALYLPPHRLDMVLLPPIGFTAGSLRVKVSAVDVTGNIGPCADVIVPAFGGATPKPRARPVPKLWAHDAAEYVETAEVTIEWPSMNNAVRYEVERGLESAFSLHPDDDDHLLISAAESIGEERGFERLTDSAFLPSWTDHLPGRAPARAIYRVRGLSAAGGASAWVLVALVRVPDVRIAPQPCLIEAVPASKVGRTIQLCWTQPGPIAGIGFAVESREARAGHFRDESLAPAEGWTRLADLLPSAIVVDGSGRYRTTIPNLEPGRWFDYRVVPIRHALDPDDPRVRNMRRIDGYPSNIMRARAEGTLRPPTDMRIIVTNLGAVTIRWSNKDSYRWLEIRWRPPGRSGFYREALAEGTETFSGLILDAEGDWQFELTAIGHGCRAVSERVGLIWPKP
jgi:hypothetical protein